MSRAVILLVVLSMGLGACGIRDSRLNPFNWFGNSREAAAPQQPENTNPLIPSQRQGLFSLRAARERAALYRGQPVDVINGLVIERVPGGAIVRAEGVSRFQNTYDVRLIPANEDLAPENGVLEFRLEAVIPEKPIAGGADRVRTVSAGRPLTDGQLEGVRAIRVAGLQNARISSRR